MVNRQDAVTYGAYGLRLRGLASCRWIGRADDAWTVCTISEELRVRQPQILNADHANFWLSQGGAVEMDRKRGSAVVVSTRRRPDAAMAHPTLATIGAIWADWESRLSFHAGSFMHPDGGAWVLMGDRRRGKSSALAWLATHGACVLSDDLTITDGEQVLAGPRCLDLREPAAQHYGIGEDIGVVGTRRRWRVELPDAPLSVPLKGWIVLDWGRTPHLSRAQAADRVDRLSRSRALPVAQQHPLAWLGALAKPMYRFSRPRSWLSLDTSMEMLLQGLASE